ncbi:MAG: hypothetical protein IH623_20140 [Verrucomicrobia bacterium]|nr:hypothetical protein [Verrucomicrobiota bacterium]
MSKFFVYKLTVDNGGAPYVTEDLLTLAICKPSVRAAADLGDWIFGFGDNQRIGNRLIYIAKVTGKLVNAAYYGASAFWSRPDCIYRWTKAGALKPKANPRYHGSPEDARKDVGRHPDYRRANVLLSTNFRYFGGADCNLLSDEVQAYVHSITLGHRSDKSLGQFKRALKELQVKVWRRYSDRSKIGEPTHPESRAKCYGGKHGVC